VILGIRGDSPFCHTAFHKAHPFPLLSDVHRSVITACGVRCSAPKLSHVISQAIFCIPGFVKASLHQRLDPLLRGWSSHRSKARVPPGCNFDVRRQTSSVDKALSINDCPFVERGDPGRKRIDKPVKLSIRQRPIHIPVELGQVAVDVVRA